MRKSIIFATSAASAVFGSAAFAADIPRRTLEPAPVVQAVPIFTWTGFYVGVNAGYIFDTGKTTITGSAALLATGLTPGATKTLGDGFTIGGTLGYNYQIGNIVFGLEADLNYVDLGKTVAFANGGIATTSSQDATYLGTVRARLGFAIDRLLIYGTGGLAYGDTDASTTITAPGALWVGNKSSTKFGYAVGAGLEYALTTNLSAKVEYLYYDLGKTNYTSPQVAGAAVPGVFGTASAENKGQLVRAGINYRF
jgi:outer membrane immunogenic protein